MRTKGLIPNNINYMIPFLVPVLILGLNYALLGIYPFGDKTILISDLSGQYIDYYSTFHTILSEGKSLFYSWQAGMGLNFIGLFAYYLSSPFSLLIVLFPKEKLPEALALITLLKIGAAGLSFAIYANRVFKESQTTTSLMIINIFSTLYALSAYSVVYSFNLMWLDGVILLPLVLLAVELLLKTRQFFRFYLALVFMFVANFYLSYMVGLFSFLYFLVRYFSLHTLRNLQMFFQTLGLFLLSALLAAGSAAFLLVPTFYSLRNGPGSPLPLSSLTSFSHNFPFVDLFSKLPLGAYDTISNAGLPNLYSGLLPLLLLPLFFLTLRHRRNERVLNALLLITLILSFYYSNLNLIWHAFDTPNSFPYRYSFLFSFLIITLALRTFLKLNASNSSRYTPLDARTLWVVYGLWVFFFFLLQRAGYPHLSRELLGLNLTFITVYAGLLQGLLKAKRSKNYLLLTLMGFVVLETSINTGQLLKQLNANYHYVTKESYTERLDPINHLIGEIPPSASFFRIERTIGRSYNDPMNANYPGITHFSSLANLNLHQFLHQLGFSTSPNTMWVNYAGATPVTDSFLGMAYIISPPNKAPEYPTLSQYNNFALYANPWALPLCFLVDRSLLSLDSTNPNPFQLQNEMLNLSLGSPVKKEKPISFFSSLSVREMIPTNLRITQVGDKQHFEKLDPSQEASLEFIIDNPKDQHVYAFLPAETSKALVYANNHYLGPYFDIYNKKVLDLGLSYYDNDNDNDLDSNKELKIKFILQENRLILENYYFYGFEESRFNEAITNLRFNTLNDLQVGNTFIRGNVDVKERSLLYTSVPYDPGWEGFVDGKQTSLATIGNAFIGMVLPPGNHEVTLSFNPQGFRIGLLISLLSTLSVLGLLILLKFLRKKTV